TLSRTLLTSFTTISAIIVLIFFGGVDLRAMALVLLIGFITGTYSSVFVASPLLILWEKLLGKKKELKKV
ncbi:MAG TPA: protein translocase subunit SecF, partial [Spirochaetia bacterium]|nr:protein translocase subunit SecF [Spirochaetia bacterium]